MTIGDRIKPKRTLATATPASDTECADSDASTGSRTGPPGPAGQATNNPDKKSARNVRGLGAARS